MVHKKGHGAPTVQEFVLKRFNLRY